MIEDVDQIEIEEVDPDHWIALESSRRWPKYLVSWSVRRRAGETDFPLAHGEVESLPPRGTESLAEMWARIRREALIRARAASEPAIAAEDESKPRSRFGRWLRRR